MHCLVNHKCESQIIVDYKAVNHCPEIKKATGLWFNLTSSFVLFCFFFMQALVLLNNMLL